MASGVYRLLMSILVGLLSLAHAADSTPPSAETLAPVQSPLHPILRSTSPMRQMTSLPLVIEVVAIIRKRMTQRLWLSCIG